MDRTEVRRAEAAHARRLEAVNEIARIATLDLELRPMMQRITDALAQKFGWELAALVTVDAERTAFVCEAVSSARPTEIHPGYSRPLGSGVVGEVAATEQPILLDDVRQSPNYVETMDGALSELCVPVRHGGRLVAILNVESTRPAAFHDQLALLVTVADQIAGAIANARLYQETRRRAALMQMMSEVSRTALEADDLDELLRRVVGYVRERFPVEVVAINLHAQVDGKLAHSARAGERSGVPTTDLGVPIRFRQELLGVLKIESRSTDVFTPENVVAFESFAGQVAGAIHLASMKEMLHRLSATDPLTGTANRRQFDEAMQREWRRAARAESALTLMMIDIDEFKRHNDAHGHQAGDECLRRVAETLRQRLHRAGDLIARYGGEEFAVLLAGIDPVHAPELAESLRHSVADGCGATISIGVATVIPSRDADPETLIRAADEALYAAKRAGRNRVHVAR